jgi:hypothetical protein
MCTFACVRRARGLTLLHFSVKFVACIALPAGLAPPKNHRHYASGSAAPPALTRSLRVVAAGLRCRPGARGRFSAAGHGAAAWQGHTRPRCIRLGCTGSARRSRVPLGLNPGGPGADSEHNRRVDTQNATTTVPLPGRSTPSSPPPPLAAYAGRAPRSAHRASLGFGWVVLTT